LQAQLNEVSLSRPEEGGGDRPPPASEGEAEDLTVRLRHAEMAASSAETSAGMWRQEHASLLTQSEELRQQLRERESALAVAQVAAQRAAAEAEAVRETSEAIKRQASEQQAALQAQLQASSESSSQLDEARERLSAAEAETAQLRDQLSLAAAAAQRHEELYEAAAMERVERAVEQERQSAMSNSRISGGLSAEDAPSSVRASQALPKPDQALRSLQASVARACKIKAESGWWWSYQLHVASGGISFTISRRFSEFKKLHEVLRLLHLPPGRLPLLPPKYSARSQTEQFAEDRRQALDEYVRFIVADRDVRSSPDLHRFLEIGLLLGQSASP